ncbi:bifunctional folylpolyglutamate synthetase/dihydrofolate synthetase [Candidatus Nitrotoga sp. BS]|uniref:bifunctional tetrahydrofolate synthase/dihydrofolate synthase n=1 Tax=Candidatus Nitrotoga sp. BS TaxID=2890408 RepID=UPI001EF1A2ED|nr:bifunctional tetrahydrofolate synthase/dihydrofolate synthase [Candidatus Nitrotoga sp. BS]CAH1188922.1 bifunctional folylpolyglutamate synthetase/dihydrofolate synthetase [Candidatus Nitrotoga sp. BS]
MLAKHSALSDWLDYLETKHPKAIELGLERVAKVKQQLGLNPTFPVIVVGGTNGKGSVCAMLESMLHAAGYRVGCYTSPHLLDYNERVRIGQRQASDMELCAAFERVEQARTASHLQNTDSHLWGKDELSEVSLTYFEFGTLAAMQCFIDQAVEVAILEVGLGGRLDAVNVFDHDCAVVTSIDLDHMEYLGDTREEIAFEKAGIFRVGKVAVFGDMDVPITIRAQAQHIGAQLWCLSEQFSFTAGAQQWNYHGVNNTRSALPYPALRGAFQLHNASAALAALDALKNKLPVSMAAVRRGLVEVVLPGRFQIVPGRPMLILDVAHNPQAARSLAQNLTDLPPCKKTFAVFAMLKDKDMASVARALKGQVDVWLVAGIAAPRGATTAELSSVLYADGVKCAVLTFVTVTDALQYACNEAVENDRIIAFGSFYTVAEVMRAQSMLRLI